MINDNDCIEYDFFVSRFGRGLIAGSGFGICDIAFTEAPHAELVRELEMRNPGRTFVHEPGRFADLCRHMFAPEDAGCELDMQGSEFQMQVWSELCSIPLGQTITYQQLAHRLGRPTATRAVANAVAKNRIAFLVPCHRVIRADGAVGGYRWGVERKAALLAWECECGAASGSARTH